LLFKELLNESTLGVVIEIERDILYEVKIRTNISVPNWIPVAYWVEVDIENERFSCNCKGF
jgi:uncharacterized membrane protein